MQSHNDKISDNKASECPAEIHKHLVSFVVNSHLKTHYIDIYYIDESVLLEIKPLVDSIRYFIRDPSGVFSVCHLCECHIVQ